MVRVLIESSLGYPGLFLACAGSGIFVPMPEDVPLLYAGTRIASGAWAWPITLAVAWVGVVTRDVTSWAVGRFLGKWLLATGRARWLLGGNRIDRAQRLVTNHGAAAVLLGRFMVGFRTPVFFAAGAMGVSLRSFFMFDALGLTVAVPLAVGLGYWFGSPVAELAASMLQRASTVVMLITVVIVGLVAWRAMANAAERVSAAEDESA
jgi:membrane protein DedA with SNARE-associated domain